MDAFCKEINKLVGSSNFLGWKKRIHLVLTKNKVMEYDFGEVTQTKRENTLDDPS